MELQRVQQPGRVSEWLPYLRLKVADTPPMPGGNFRIRARAVWQIDGYHYGRDRGHLMVIDGRLGFMGERSAWSFRRNHRSIYLNGATSGELMIDLGDGHTLLLTSHDPDAVAAFTAWQNAPAQDPEADILPPRTPGHMLGWFNRPYLVVLMGLLFISLGVIAFPSHTLEVLWVCGILGSLFVCGLFALLKKELTARIAGKYVVWRTLPENTGAKISDWLPLRDPRLVAEERAEVSDLLPARVDWLIETRNIATDFGYLSILDGILCFAGERSEWSFRRNERIVDEYRVPLSAGASEYGLIVRFGDGHSVCISVQDSPLWDALRSEWLNAPAANPNGDILPPRCPYPAPEPFLHHGSIHPSHCRFATMYPE